MKTWAASSVDCGIATRTPGAPHVLRPAAVAVEERLLAADPAQHAQPGGRVGAERGQLRRPRGAARPDARWSGLITVAEQQHEDRHAEEHDEPQHDRRRQQDDRDDD